MEFRRAKKEDVKDIMIIVKMAQDYFKEQEIDQWQKGYPNEDVIKKDINDDHSYVLTDDGKVVGTTFLSFDGEETYKTIYEGEWLTNGIYAVIHRIAVDRNFKRKGIASEILKGIENKCKEKVKSIKIDTHKANIAMQRFLQKNNFKQCGIIYLNDGNERIAFEKILG